jgi:hypothetical protein
MSDFGFASIKMIKFLKTENSCPVQTSKGVFRVRSQFRTLASYEERVPDSNGLNELVGGEVQGENGGTQLGNRETTARNEGENS